MSASKNPEAVANQQEEQFSASVPATGPMTTKGHQPGTQQGAPEYNMEVLPAGSAPADKSYESNLTAEAAPPAEGSDDTDDPRPSAADTLGGATSADVHAGYGHPGSGMSSQEQAHDGQVGRKKQPQGQLGPGLDDANEGNDGPRETTDDVGVPAAEEQEPVSAEEVAAEAPGGLQATGSARES